MNETTTEQRSAAWHKARVGKVTGSRYPAIAGLNPYQSREDVLREMVREACGAEREFQGNVATRWGTEHEADAIAAYEADTGEVVYSCGLFVHPDHPNFGGSPDGLAGEGGGILIETKCPYSSGIPDEAPPHYVAQVRWNMMVVGVTEADLVYWTPGDYKVFPIAPWSAEEKAQALKIAYDFLDDYNDALADSDKYLEDKVLERRDADWVIAAFNFRQAKAHADDATAALTNARQRLQELADGRACKGEGARVTYYERAGNIDWKRFKAEREILDEEVESYRKPSTTVARIEIDET